MALEDAITLFQAFTATDNVQAAFQRFEQIRRPGMEKILDIAQQSYTWYETFHEKMELDALPLAYSYMTRSGRIDDETLLLKAPHFMTSYRAYVSTKFH